MKFYKSWIFWIFILLIISIVFYILYPFYHNKSIKYDCLSDSDCKLINMGQDTFGCVNSNSPYYKENIFDKLSDTSTLLMIRPNYCICEWNLCIGYNSVYNMSFYPKY